MKYLFARKKRFIVIIVILVVFCSTYYKSYTNTDTIIYQSFTTKDKVANQVIVSGEDEDEFVTLFTTFVDPTDRDNFNYRQKVQLNFLKMSTYKCFQNKVKFVVFTRSQQTKESITKYYPHISVLHTPLRGNFNTPMLKDLFLLAMEKKQSFFYMFANADNLYDSSLMKTLSAVRRSWLSGFIRQKLIIYGQRNNVVVYDEILDEVEFSRYFMESNPFTSFAQDYFIVTKDSIEWDLYPEVLIGRTAYDNYLVDFSVRSELESVDASSSIHLLHQSEEHTDHSSLDLKNSLENKWNARLSNLQGVHYSTTCARYVTEYDPIHGTVIINDKRYNTVISNASRSEDYFEKEHNYWIDYSHDSVYISTHSEPILTIIVFAYNKPESLDRLLSSLQNIHGVRDRIDLVISVDKGHTGYYDVPTLAVSHKFIWEYGNKRVVLKKTHTGQLLQWIEAIDYVEDKESFVMMLEDCVVLAKNWYDYVMSVLRHKHASSLSSRIAGWTLEPPLVTQSTADSILMLYKFIAKVSSVTLSEIKRVRSFVLIRSVWEMFLDWFRRESGNVSKQALTVTFAFRLDNRGNYTNWERGLWISWYSYWISSEFPKLNRFAYIINNSGNLCSKLHVTYVKDWDRRNVGCYGNQILRNEVGVPSVFDMDNSINSVLIPEHIPNYKIGVIHHD